MSIPHIILKNKYRLRYIAYFFGFIGFFRRVYLMRKFLQQREIHTILAVDDYFSLITIFASLGLNIKIVSSVRNNWNRLYKDTLIHLLPDFMYKKLLPYLLNRYVSSVHTVSKDLAQNLQEQYGIKNTHCIYNIFDFEKIQTAAQISPSYSLPANYIINVGHFNQQKNQKELLEIFKTLKEMALVEHLVFIGDGSNKALLQDYCKSLNIEESVHFLGKQKNPYPYIKQAQYYFATSLYEGLPAVLVESLFLQTPFLSYDCDYGPRELSQNITDMNPQAFINKAKVLLPNPMPEQNKRERDIMLKNFDTKYIIEQWIKIL